MIRLHSLSMSRFRGIREGAGRSLRRLWGVDKLRLKTQVYLACSCGEQMESLQSYQEFGPRRISDRVSLNHDFLLLDPPCFLRALTQPGSP